MSDEITKSDSVGPVEGDAIPSLEDAFPDVNSIILSVSPNIDDLLNDCVFALDTSVLLKPFELGTDSLANIRQKYEKLVQEKRILIPARAVREFARRRVDLVREIHQQISARLNSLPTVKGIECPIVHGLEAYREVGDCINELNDIRRRLYESLTEMKSSIEKWNANDPVSQMYAEVLNAECICDHNVALDDLRKDLRRRNAHRIPPGYKDKGKHDEGVGDLAIWLTLIQAGAARKRNIVLVTHDHKADWIINSNKQGLFPRPELTAEFFHATGCHFYILTFDAFLRRLGADEATVTEVEESSVPDDELFGDIAPDPFDEMFTVFEECRSLLTQITEDALSHREVVGECYRLASKCSLLSSQDQIDDFQMEVSSLRIYLLDIANRVESLMHTHMNPRHRGQLRRAIRKRINSISAIIDQYA